MFFASDKEYEFLKKETVELRNCITKYIGHIIGVAGISGAVLQVIYELQDKHSNRIDLSSLYLLTMVIITLLFEVVWYKFKSHNRHVAYIQLLAQEVDHYNLKGLKEKELISKTYLDNPAEKVNRVNFGKENIFTWESSMSRLNGSNAKNKINNIIHSTNKSKFIFTLPENYKYSQLKSFNSLIQEKHSPDVIPLDEEFFRKVIFPIYGKGIGIFNLNRVDTGYLKNGWQYPKVITFTSFIPILIIYILQWINLCGGIKEFNFLSAFNSIYTCFLFGGSTLILLKWIIFHLLNLRSLNKGKNSIESYCWTFFIYRVQVLNSFGVLPSYFSRSFLRFFKSRLILEQIIDNKDKFMNYISGKINNIDKMNNYQDAINEYVSDLKNCKIFSKKSNTIHELFKEFKTTNNLSA